jgi:hypothetical protein
MRCPRLARASLGNVTHMTRWWQRGFRRQNYPAHRCEDGAAAPAGARQLAGARTDAKILRRTASDLHSATGAQSRRISFAKIVEMSMSHVIASETEVAYFHSDLLDKRRPLMDAWAKFCLTLWERFGAKADNVIALRQSVCCSSRRQLTWGSRHRWVRSRERQGKLQIDPKRPKGVHRVQVRHPAKPDRPQNSVDWEGQTVPRSGLLLSAVRAGRSLPFRTF